MSNVTKEQHEDLLKILYELVDTIKLMQDEKRDNLLSQNEDEAKLWIIFLESHADIDSLKLLEQEISSCFVSNFGVAIRNSESDKKRTELMKMYLTKSAKYLNTAI